MERVPSLSSATSPSLIDGLRAREDAAWDRLVALRLQGFKRRGPGDSFRGWLHSVTRTRIVDHVRRWRREPVGVGGSSILRQMLEVPARADDPETSADGSAGPAEATIGGALRGTFLLALATRAVLVILGAVTVLMASKRASSRDSRFRRADVSR